MVRQYELAKLDEAKDGPLLQQIDKAVPPDYKAKPSRALIVLAGTLAALLVAVFVLVFRRYTLISEEKGSDAKAAWVGMKRAWRPGS